MSVCPYCHQEMTDNVGCVGLPFGPDEVPPIKHDDFEPCHDCGCPSGTFHHPGCDAEVCPICGDQAIGCGCDNEDDWETDE